MKWNICYSDRHQSSSTEKYLYWTLLYTTQGFDFGETEEPTQIFVENFVQWFTAKIEELEDNMFWGFFSTYKLKQLILDWPILKN